MKKIPSLPQTDIRWKFNHVVYKAKNLQPLCTLFTFNKTRKVFTQLSWYWKKYVYLDFFKDKTRENLNKKKAVRETLKSDINLGAQKASLTTEILHSSNVIQVGRCNFLRLHNLWFKQR